MQLPSAVIEDDSLELISLISLSTMYITVSSAYLIILKLIDVRKNNDNEHRI